MRRARGMMDPLLIGVDGGGTRCRARIRDLGGALIGEGSGGPANIRLGPDVAGRSILEACEAALRAGGLEPGRLDGSYAGLGLAGAGQASDREALLRAPLP